MGANPNAIGSVVPPFGGGGGAAALSSALPVLWEWNRSDVLQFDTPLDFTDTLGVGPSGGAALAFVANAFQGAPGIRVTGTNFRGGFMFPVLASELALPSRYILEARLVGLDASMDAILGLWGNADPATLSTTGWRGMVHRRARNNQNLTRLTTFGAVQTQQVLRTVTFAGSDALAINNDVSAQARGGCSFVFECFRQEGVTPADWVSRLRYDDTSNRTAGGLASSLVTGAGATSPDWDGEDMDRFGLGILNDSAGVASGTTDFLDLRVFQHPFDIPR